MRLKVSDLHSTKEWPGDIDNGQRSVGVVSWLACFRLARIGRHDERSAETDQRRRRAGIERHQADSFGARSQQMHESSIVTGVVRYHGRYDNCINDEEVSFWSFVLSNAPVAQGIEQRIPNP